MDDKRTDGASLRPRWPNHLQAVALNNLGALYLRRGQPVVARDHHLQAQQLASEAGIAYQEAQSLAF